MVDHDTSDPTLGRIGAFSDGVFAFAITLLVVAIRIPHPNDADASRGLLALLSGQWRSYLAFVLSFMLGGINWANHRVMFATFAHADHTLTWLNLLYLMLGVAFIVFYGAAATVGGLAYNLVWWYGAYAAKLTSPALSPLQRRAHTLAWGRSQRRSSARGSATQTIRWSPPPAPLVMATLTGIAFLSPALAVGGYVAMVFAFILPLPRLMALKQRRHLQSRHGGRRR